MIARGRQLLMADADGATRISDLAKLEAVMKSITDPGRQATAPTCLTYRCMFMCKLILSKGGKAREPMSYGSHLSITFLRIKR